MSAKVKYIAHHEIHRAAYYGNIDTVEKLIQTGQDINCRNRKGNTPLMMALLGTSNKKTKGKLLNFLLNHGADVNAVNEDGDSTLHVAINASSKKFVESLLNSGADNTLVNTSGQTASQLAYQLGNVKLGTLLLFYERPTIQNPAITVSTISNTAVNVPINDMPTLPNKPVGDTLSPKNSQLDKSTRKEKSPGLIDAIFSCIFPTCAFHRQLQKDFTEVVRKSETQIPTNEKNVQNDTQKRNASETGTTIRLHLCNGNLVEGKHGNVMLHQHVNTSHDDMRKEHIHFNEDQDFPSFHGDNNKSSNEKIHQLPHIGNECNMIRKNDGNVHRLPHIGNECNIIEQLEYNKCYVYA